MGDPGPNSLKGQFRVLILMQDMIQGVGQVGGSICQSAVEIEQHGFNLGITHKAIMSYARLVNALTVDEIINIHIISQGVTLAQWVIAHPGYFTDFQTCLATPGL